MADMATIFVKKLDETTMHIDSDDYPTLCALSDAFSFYSDGYKFDPRFRAHIWDGRIRMINRGKKTTLVGLYNRIQTWCVTNNVGFSDLSDQKLEKDDLSNFDKWIEDLKLPFEIRDYQKDAVLHTLNNFKNLLLSPTGSGKSLIAYCLARWMHEHNRKTVIIVPSTSLVEQLHADFKQYSENNHFDVDNNVDKLYAKTKDNIDVFNDHILITTWQSIVKYDKSVFKSWDCVIVDEAHNAKAKMLKNVVENATNAVYKIGMTGSLSSCVSHEYTIVGILGDTYQVTTTKKLQNKGELSSMTIYMVNLKYPKIDCQDLWNQTKSMNKNYQFEINYINNHQKRQLFVRNLVCALKGTTLVLFRFRKAGKRLYEMIKEKVGDKRPVFHIDGRVDAQTREKIRHSANNNEDVILVCSVGTSATGLNIPSIENLILNPTKSKVQSLQSVGRSLRLCEGKDHAKVFDLVDDLSVGRHQNYCLKHSAQRYEIYGEQGFDVVFKQVQF